MDSVTEQSRHLSSIYASTAMIGKTAGEHAYLLQNLSIIPQPPLPTNSSTTEVSMALIHALYTSIMTTNSSPPLQKNGLTAVHNHIHNVLKQINYKRSNLHIEKARHFNIDEWVLVDRRNLQVKTGNNKSLTQKWLGPYKVIKGIGSHAYRLEVPVGTRWYNVVHTILFQPFRRRDEPQDMDEDEEEIWEVEEIVNSRRVKGVV